MRILLTGASGFLGKIFLTVFQAAGHQVVTLGRSSNCNHVLDLTQSVPVIDQVFDVIVHAAGKAHAIPRTQQEEKEFHDVNVKGTLNLLRGLEQARPKQIVFISSVSVYGLETGSQIKETESLSGTTPYALSKIETEKLLDEWSASNRVQSLILRLPLIAGPNPPGNLGAMIKAIRQKRYVNIDGGKASRSMVLAEDVAELILNSADKSGCYNLTDGHHPSFKEIEQCIAGQLKLSSSWSIPGWLAKIMGSVGDVIPGFPVTSLTISKMTNDLTFNDDAARKELNWRPKPVLDYFTVQ